MRTSLRGTTLIIMGVTAAGMVALLLVVAHIILLQSFIHLEEQSVQRDVQRALAVLANDLTNLDRTAGDWALWDDTYAFIEDENPDYVASNLGDSALANLQLNLILFVHSSGRVVLGKAFDPTSRRPLPIPQSFSEHLSPGSPLLSHSEVSASLTGIVSLPEGPMLIASRPIATSAFQGPIRGTLIMGRYLGEGEVSHLASVTQLPLILNLPDATQLPAAVSQCLSESKPVCTHALDEGTIAGYGLVKDLYGQPAFVLQVNSTREISQQGQTSVLYYTLWLVASCLAVVAACMIVLERQVLSRVMRLSTRVQHIATTGDHAARVDLPGRDELSALASALNTMLGTLEGLRQHLEELVQERSTELLAVNQQLQQEVEERKQAEEALRQFTTELQTRNAELDAYAHTVAHDIQGPLASIAGYAETLERYWGLLSTEDVCEHLRTLTLSSHKVSNIVDELLLLATVRREEVQLQPLHMGTIVAEVQRRMADMVAQYQAEIVVPERWPNALGYGPWVEEVWVNYLSNALKYGGRPPRVEMGATAQEDGFVRFWVRDNGGGVPPEQQARLFQPFSQLGPVRAEGEGLGLSIVQRIVEKLGGQVAMESSAGQGSEFSFTLRATAES
jgi:sensor domain CHASE-containing protein/nitrogen-specific signal transduction histidine kinase